jgi:molybdopterin synthase sulfur carrier subunit
VNTVTTQIQIKIITPSLFNAYTNGSQSHCVKASTVSEALLKLVDTYPQLKPHLFDDAGQWLSYIQLFLNDDNIREPEAFNMPLSERDELVLLAAVAGG